MVRKELHILIRYKSVSKISFAHVYIKGHHPFIVIDYFVGILLLVLDIFMCYSII